MPFLLDRVAENLFQQRPRLRDGAVAIPVYGILSRTFGDIVHVSLIHRIYRRRLDYGATPDEAIAEGRGIAPKGAPKVGMYFNPGSTPWFETLVNKNGVAINMSLPSTLSRAQMTPSKYEDPFDQMAEQWLKMNFGMGCREARQRIKNRPFASRI